MQNAGIVNPYEQVKLEGLLLTDLRGRVKMHGVKKTIKSSTGCSYQTINDLVANGYARSAVITKITHYLTNGQVHTKAPIEIVCDHFKLKPEDLLKRGNAEARQIAAYLLIRCPKTTFKQIAEHLGYANPSGAQFAVKEISDRMGVELPLRKTVLSLQAKAGL